MIPSNLYGIANEVYGSFLQPNGWHGQAGGLAAWLFFFCELA